MTCTYRVHLGTGPQVQGGHRPALAGTSTRPHPSTDPLEVSADMLRPDSCSFPWDRLPTRRCAMKETKLDQTSRVCSKSSVER